MKKIMPLFTVAVTALVATMSFRSPEAAPKLYPELETYFKTIDAKAYQKDQLSSLESIRQNVTTSDFGSDDWNVIFYCTENSFRSQASQVFLETLCYAKKHKKVNAYSAGLKTGTVNPKLISYLEKIGYKISRIEKDGQTAYEVKYSDNARPIIIYSKEIHDKSIPKKDAIDIIVCDRAKETTCNNLKSEVSTFELPFKNVSPDDSEESIETTIKAIAVAMQYITESKR